MIDKKEVIKKVKETKDKGIEKIKAQPLGAVAICFAIGAVIGAGLTALIKRR